MIFVKRVIFAKLVIYRFKCRNPVAAMDVLDTLYRLPYGPILNTRRRASALRFNSDIRIDI